MIMNRIRDSGGKPGSGVSTLYLNSIIVVYSSDDASIMLSRLFIFYLEECQVIYSRNGVRTKLMEYKNFLIQTNTFKHPFIVICLIS